MRAAEQDCATRLRGCQCGIPYALLVVDPPRVSKRMKAVAARSDRFGRIFRFVRYGEAVSGRVAKEGYSSQDVNRVCRSGGPSRAKVTVVMRAVR